MYYLHIITSLFLLLAFSLRVA